MRVIFLFLAIASICAHAATDIGKPLAFKTHSGGKPHVGISYTYGNDADGPSYMFTYLPAVPPAQGRQRLRWNFYQVSTDRFLLNWSAQRTLPLAVLQAQLNGATDASVIRVLLKGQGAPKGEAVFFVLADDSNRPIYNISITQLCRDWPKSFDDLTTGRACDDAEI